MSFGNTAYLVLVAAGYGVFILVLGAYWLRSALGDKPAPAAKPQPVSKPPQVRKAA